MFLEQKSKITASAILKLFLAAVILICFSTVLGTAGYLAGNRPVKNSQPTFSPAMISVLPTSDITSNINGSVDNWQTYRNEKYGFEIKYPDDFEGREPETGDILLEAVKKDSGGYYYFTIKTRANYKIDQDASIVINSEKIIIGDHPSYKYFYTEGIGKSGVVLIQAGGDELIISFDFIGNGQIGIDRKTYFQDFFNQILSTFKLIEKDKIKDTASDFCTGKSPSTFRDNYTGYINNLFMNFDSDSDKEILGVCSTGDSKQDQEGLLFVLDLNNDKYMPVLEQEGSIQHQRYYDFQNLMIKDIDKDGVDEIIYEGEGWYMAGGDSWLKVYSPKYEEWFIKTKSWSLDETDPTGEKRKEEITFSSNLKNKKYQVFKDFLTEKQFAL